MKKLFISPLMDGKTDEEFLKERKNAIKSAEKILKEPVEVIDLIFQAGSDTANKPLWFISESLKLLSTADIAYFRKVGKARERAELSTPALLSTGLQ